MSRVTTQTDIQYGSALSNYAEMYSAWNEGHEEECPQCHGTGMDRDEVYECELCFGEGVLVFMDLPDE